MVEVQRVTLLYAPASSVQGKRVRQLSWREEEFLGLCWCWVACVLFLFCHLLALWPWPSHWTSVRPLFFTQMGTLDIPVFQGCQRIHGKQSRGASLWALWAY